MRINSKVSFAYFLLLAFLGPVMIFLYLVNKEKNSAIDFTQREILGSHFLNKLGVIKNALILVSIEEFLENAKNRSELSDASNTIEQDFIDLINKSKINDRELRLDEQHLNDYLHTVEKPQVLFGQWKAYLEEADLNRRRQLIVNLISQMSELEKHVIDHSGLILDVDLDSFYTIDVLFRLIPEIEDHFQRVGRADSRQWSDPQSWEGLERLFSKLKASIRSAVLLDAESYGYSGLVQNRLDLSSRSLIEAISDHYRELNLNDVDAGLAESLFAQRSLSAIGTFRNDVVLVLRELLEARISALKADRAQAAMGVIVTWLIAFGLTLWSRQKFFDSMYDILMRLKRLSTELRATSQQLYGSAEKSAESAQNEALAIKNSRDSLASISERLSLTAQQSVQARELTFNVLTKANQGRDVIRNLGASIDHIAQTNNELTAINMIIDAIAQRTQSINDIVFKTQLLAVNASIEAARAGQNGKAFSIVAGEISSLANTSGKAANEIRELLNSSRMQVEDILSNIRASVESGQNISGQAVRSYGEMTDHLGGVVKIAESVSLESLEHDAAVVATSKTLQAINAASVSSRELSVENYGLSREVRAQAEKLEELEKYMQTLIYRNNHEANKSRLKISSAFFEKFFKRTEHQLKPLVYRNWKNKTTESQDVKDHNDKAS